MRGSRGGSLARRPRSMAGALTSDTSAGYCGTGAPSCAVTTASQPAAKTTHTMMLRDTLMDTLKQR